MTHFDQKVHRLLGPKVYLGSGSLCHPFSTAIAIRNWHQKCVGILGASGVRKLVAAGFPFGHVKIHFVVCFPFKCPRLSRLVFVAFLVHLAMHFGHQLSAAIRPHFVFDFRVDLQSPKGSQTSCQNCVHLVSPKCMDLPFGFCHFVFPGSRRIFPADSCLFVTGLQNCSVKNSVFFNFLFASLRSACSVLCRFVAGVGGHRR